MRDASDSFRTAIMAALGAAPDTIEPGRLQRFSTNGRRGDLAGWCVLHTDGIPAGAFGCWRTGRTETWCARADAELTQAERARVARQFADIRRLRAAEQASAHAEAAATAAARWAIATPADDHPYLQRKAVRAYGVRCLGGALLVPMRTADGVMHSLQSIGRDGTKRFLPGGRVKGCFHGIGKPHGVLTVAEGYATGATIHEATGQAVAVAFNAGNLEPVARALRVRLPCADIVIAGDDDHRTAGNPGRAAAEQAALSVGGVVVLPTFPLPRPAEATDFNDLAALAGLPAVRLAFAECLEAAS